MNLMSRSWVVACVGLSIAATAACSDDGLPADSAPTTSSAGDSSPTGDAAGGTTRDAEGTAAADSSTSTASTTSENPLDSTGFGGTSDASGTTSSGLDTSTGEPPLAFCETPDDCVIVDDCCTCGAALVGSERPACEMECIQSACAALGIDPVAQCEHDSCELVPLSCSPFDATCDQTPPDCPAGQAAPLDPKSGCWTGGCVPAEFCDVVPDCADCPDDETCVEFIAHLPRYTCTPIPLDCGGTASCDCLGEVCESPFDLCSDEARGGGIACFCPAC